VRKRFVSSLIFMINAIQIGGVLSSGFSQENLLYYVPLICLLLVHIIFIDLLACRSRFLSCALVNCMSL